MYAIQYRAGDGSSKLQYLDVKSRQKLTKHLASFECSILGVFEQSTPITEAVRKDLTQWTGRMTAAAKAFAAKTPV